MNLDKISAFIKRKRKELGMTQEQLAEKLFVTEKAISRWETGRGTPDISLLVPLAKELKIDISELLNGEENKKGKGDVEKLIEYEKMAKANKYNLTFKLTSLFYFLSLLSFLFYLRCEYNPNTELNYLLRFTLTFTAAILIITGNRIYSCNYVEKIEDKNKMAKISQSIVFVYYAILLFNTAIFARYTLLFSYNFIPFKSIIEILNTRDFNYISISLLGNIVIFMPLEYFIIELFGVKKFSLVFVLSFSIFLAVELFQFIFKVGSLDIDDLLLRTLGSIIFYFVFKRFKNSKII